MHALTASAPSCWNPAPAMREAVPCMRRGGLVREHVQLWGGGEGWKRAGRVQLCLLMAHRCTWGTQGRATGRRRGQGCCLHWGTRDRDISNEAVSIAQEMFL